MSSPSPNTRTDDISNPTLTLASEVHPDQNLDQKDSTPSESTGDELGDAIADYQRLVDALPDDYPHKPIHLHNLGVAFQTRFKRLGDIKELENAISVRQKAVDLTSDDHPDKPSYLNTLGASLEDRFQCLGNPTDIDLATSVGMKAVSLTPDGNPDKAGYLNNLAISFQTRFRRFGELADLEQAISIKQQVADLTSDDHDEKPGRLMNLGNAFLLRFLRLGELKDLENAISAQEKAVELTHEGDPAMRGYLHNLGTSFDMRFRRFGELTDLKQALSAKQRAVRLTPDDHPQKPTYYDSLGAALHARFNRLGELSDLEEAIENGQKAVDLTPDDHIDKPQYLNNLGNTIESRFKRLGELPDIEKAILSMRQAVDLTPNDHPSKPQYLANLGMSYHTRFMRFGDLSDLEKSISAKKQAVELTPDAHPDKPSQLHSLGISFQTRFRRLGELRDIEQAVSTKRQAVELTSDSHADHAEYLNSLGNALLVRYERLGEITDIQQTILTLQRAVDLTPKNHASRPIRLSNLGVAYQTRFYMLDELMDLEQSISLKKQTLDCTPDNDPSKPRFLNNLSISLRSRFRRLKKVEDIQNAVSLQQQAAILIPDNHPDKFIYLRNLGGALVDRYESLGELADLEKAISAIRGSIDITPVGHPAKSICLQSLGNALWLQYQHSKEPTCLEQAVFNFSAAANDTSGSPSFRLHCARLCVVIQVATQIFQPPILDTCALIIQLIPRVVWLGRGIRSQLHEISSLENAVNIVAAVAISNGDIGRALEWLEEGRAILWSQMLRLRTPLDDVRVVALEIAEELQSISAKLEASAASSELQLPGESSDINNVSPEWKSQQHCALALKYEELIEEVRRLPGFENFLRPRGLSSLREAARSGPVVLFNVASSRCDALILPDTSGRIIHVPLPDLTYSLAEKMRSLSCQFLQRKGAREGAERAGYRVSARNVDEMRTVLEELWKRVVKPTLTALHGVLSSTGANRLPRVTWCGAGPLAFLPFHAAGLYGSDALKGEKTFEYAVSSYTPSLSALLHSNQQKPSTGPPRLLAISQPSTPHQISLPHTVQEISMVQGCLGGIASTWLNHEGATKAAVLNSMKDYSWIHFACHGTQDPLNPTRSAFHLYDGPLELADIMSKSFPNAELAFLSACHTARGDEKLSEEAVHLSAGMLLAGYKSVIGTMWSIVDCDAPIVAEAFYKYLIENDGGQSGSAAYALHHAVDILRSRVGEQEFTRWVPFIHLGA